MGREERLSAPKRAGVTYRSVIIGLILIPLNAVWLALVDEIWYTGEPTTLSLYPNVIFILAAVAVGNGVVGRLFPRRALSGPELLVVYVMLSVATSVGGHDMLEVLVPVLTHLHYYGSTQGQYQEVIQLVPHWLVVTDETALQSAYVGQESIFDPVNYLPWLRPLGWWLAFTLALVAVMVGLTLLFRKQWTEHEKLAYPIIQAPMTMAVAPGSLVRSRGFWSGFVIAGGICFYNGLSVLYPLLPRIPIVQVVNLQTLFTERPWSDMGEAWISFYPSIIGLCFLMPLDLAFSFWFFFLFWKLQLVMASSYGIHGMPGFPFTQEQAIGGYYMIAFTALWISRRQLLTILGLAAGYGGDRATPWERREARIAVALLAGGSLFLYAFCIRAGMTPYVVLLFFTFYYLMSLGMTRMRAELGPPSHDIYPVGAHRQVVNFLGATHMLRRNPTDLVMFGFLGFFNRVARNHPMPHIMEAFRISERQGMEHGRMLGAIVIAAAAGGVATLASLVWAFTKYGIAAQASSLPGLFGIETWSQVDIWLTTPPRPIAAPMYATIIGMASALGLAVLRMNLAWWPFHPVGYALSASLTSGRIWFCVFIAWAIKAGVLKYGGARAYPATQRFFMGLLLGDFIVGSFWYTYGIIFETNVYHFWPY